MYHNNSTLVTIPPRDTHKKLQDILTVWVFVLLFNGQGFRNLIGLIGYSALSAVTLALVVYCFWKTWDKSRTPVLLTAFVGLATLSIVWSSYRIESFVGVVILISTSLIGVLLASNYLWKRLIVLLGYALQITVGFSLLFEAFVSVIIRQPILPLFTEFAGWAGLDEKSGALYWSNNLLFSGGPIQGFMGNRNLLGFVALLLIVVSLITAMEKLSKWWLSLIWIAVGLLAHWLTVSATISLALIAVALITVGTLVIRQTQLRYKRLISWSFVGVCFILGIFALKNYEALFGFLDREPNLTNRTAIWEKVIEFAVQRPEGWGWVSYWPVWKFPFTEMISFEGIPVSHAHNAFLDVWLQLGILGVILFISIAIYLFTGTWRAVEHSNKGESFLSLGLFLLTGCLFIQALSESRLLLEGNWALLVILLMYAPAAFKKTKVKALKPIV